MRSAKSTREFFAKMKKKPALQAILDNIDGYTLEELENIGGQPLWIRQELVEIKKRGVYDPVAIAAEEAIALEELRVAEETKRQIVKNEKYEIRRWIGVDWQMPTGKDGTLKLEVGVGDIFMVTDPKNYEVKLSSSIGKLSIYWSYFLQNTELVGYMNRGEYSKFLSDSLAQKHGLSNEIHYGKKQDPNVDDRGLFRIIRH